MFTSDWKWMMKEFKCLQVDEIKWIMEFTCS